MAALTTTSAIFSFQKKKQTARTELVSSGLAIFMARFGLRRERGGMRLAAHHQLLFKLTKPVKPAVFRFKTHILIFMNGTGSISSAKRPVLFFPIFLNFD
jgi:hypothetical protein